MENKKLNDAIREITDLQKELEQRGRVEQQAEELIRQCRFEEAIKLLDSLD